MASITFGSVGDIISICQVIVTTISSLSSSRGSSVGYRALINELWSLAQALEATRSLLEQRSQQLGPPLQSQGRLRIALQNCRECLERELENIRKFSTSLGKVGPTKSARDAFWKVKWLGHKKDLSTFRQSIASHVACINLLLQASGIQLSRSHHEKTNDQLNEFGKRLRTRIDEVQESQESRHEEIQQNMAKFQEAVVDQHQALKAQIMLPQLDKSNKLDLCHNTCLEINDSSQQCKQSLRTLLDLVKGLDKHQTDTSSLTRRLEALLLQYSIPDHLQKAPLIYEDASLRKFSIDLEFIPSYDLFLSVIDSHYKGTEGEIKIKRKEYAFEDKNHKLLANLAGVWSSDILSGKQVLMRVTFDDHATPQGRCPCCKAGNDITCDKIEVTCRNCSIRYLKRPAFYRDQPSTGTLALPTFGTSPKSINPVPPGQGVCALNFFKRIQVLLKERNSVSLVQEIRESQPGYEGDPLSDRSQFLTCNLLWDRVQRSQLVLSGEADMDAICTELKSKAKCSGFGAVISQGDVDAILGPEIRKLEPLRTILNMPRMLGKQNGIREFDLENLHYPQGSPS